MTGTEFTSTVGAVSRPMVFDTRRAVYYPKPVLRGSSSRCCTTTSTPAARIGSGSSSTGASCAKASCRRWVAGNAVRRAVLPSMPTAEIAPIFRISEIGDPASTISTRAHVLTDMPLSITLRTGRQPR